MTAYPPSCMGLLRAMSLRSSSCMSDSGYKASGPLLLFAQDIKASHQHRLQAHPFEKPPLKQHCSKTSLHIPTLVLNQHGCSIQLQRSSPILLWLSSSRRHRGDQIENFTIASIMRDQMGSGKRRYSPPRHHLQVLVMFILSRNITTCPCTILQ